ncbi:hypothetical protein CRUP_012887 [Coryphaenoides rupestris]|nr:hypothetical protein CRUP_012887 [Coryphaenoides rupestris]
MERTRPRRKDAPSAARKHTGARPPTPNRPPGQPARAPSRPPARPARPARAPARQPARAPAAAGRYPRASAGVRRAPPHRRRRRRRRRRPPARQPARASPPWLPARLPACPPACLPACLSARLPVMSVREQPGFSRQKRGYRDLNVMEVNISDPLFTKQWYLVNTGQADGTPGLDLNVAEAWRLGYTGRGVTIAIMDDGIDYLHPDLASNYVSAAANNDICGVGVAYNSKVAGIRMLDQPFMTDIIEASSISHLPQVIDIYSASWGPTDDGRTVDGPRELTLQAMADGVNKSCSSTLASTFSNGRKRNPEAGVATTDLPNLTWRDTQHLSVLTSKRNQLHDEVHQWRRNGVGLEFNHLFGYGVLDAGGMVKMAREWKTVPERFHCVAGSGQDNFVRYLEHVQAVITVNGSRRGDLNVNMTSPTGTKSILLSRRPRDDDAKVGFDKWPFMTTHTWGEDPRGAWELEVGFRGPEPQRGVLKEWTLMLHGTQTAPYIDQVVRDYQSKLAMSKKEELEEELDEAVERSLKSLLRSLYLY